VIESFVRRTGSRIGAIGHTATIATLLLLSAIVLLGLPLYTDAAPVGIVSLQFASSPVAASSMLDSWSTIERSRLLWAHGLDLILPVAYAIAIVAAASRAAAGSAAAGRPAGVAAGTVVVAAIADQVENIAMGITILDVPSWTGVLVTLVAATVKSAMLLVALGALTSALLAARHTRSVAP
jgi:hypothetical protein